MKYTMLLFVLVISLFGCKAQYGYMKSGADGLPGKNGVNGVDGQNAVACTVVQTDTGAIITCGDSVAVIQNGQSPPVPTYLCHVPPGNPDKAHSIYVPDAALAAHLAHGDYLGECL